MWATAWRKSSFSDGGSTDCVEVAFWTKSSYSGGGGSDCVEVAFVSTRVAVRDSKNAPGAMLTFGLGAWRRFVLR